jgi:hypothetical protein
VDLGGDAVKPPRSYWFAVDPMSCWVTSGDRRLTWRPCTLQEFRLHYIDRGLLALSAVLVGLILALLRLRIGGLP